MNTYRNTNADVVYPFSQQMPIPFGIIGYIKVVLKKSDKVPYVTSMYSSPGQFGIDLQTDDTFLGSFIYSGDLWITLDNQEVFGFVKLNTAPVATYQGYGRWDIQRDCYNYAVQIEGISDVYVNGQHLPNSSVLQLRFAGDLASNPSSAPEDISIADNVAFAKVTPGDVGTQFYSYNPIQLDPYILSVNGAKVRNLNISSADPKVSVEGPVRVSDKIWKIIVSSNKGFPTCPQWESDAETQED